LINHTTKERIKCREIKRLACSRSTRWSKNRYSTKIWSARSRRSWAKFSK